MQTNDGLELRLNVTNREYWMVMRALKQYQTSEYEFDTREWLETEHLRTKLMKGYLG